MRKIIVTGGCGYIGSHIARAFKQNGDTVYIIDHSWRKHTVRDIDGWIINDFASEEALSFIRMNEPDVVVHCAGTSLVGPSMQDPGPYYDNNIAKTIQLLNVVKDIPKKPAIMFSSSASVYGEPDRLPLVEDDPIKPISPYGNTKAMTESILRDYWGAYALQSMCFRYFNAAGAEPVKFDLGQEPGATHIVARVLEANLKGTAFTLNGVDFDTEDHTAVRDYVHVWDIARAHVLGASYMLDDYPQMGAHVYNLSTGRGTSNLEIINYVTAKYGRMEEITYGPKRHGDPAKLYADAGKARRQLSWSPLYSDLETIIDSAYKWYQRNTIHFIK
jgi:UDP-arabinose 4-epimerase